MSDMMRNLTEKEKSVFSIPFRFQRPSKLTCPSSLKKR